MTMFCMVVASGFSGRFHRDFAHLAQVQFAGAELREGVHAEELVGARLPQIRQVTPGKLFQNGRQLPVRQFVQNDQALAFFLVRHAGDDKRLPDCAGEFVEFSSTLMCGTISPPILLKRLRRSVICRKPSSSIAATSPVVYQPSRKTSVVFSGWPR